MKSSSIVRQLFSLFAGALLFLPTVVDAQTKHIRLRTELIETTPAPAAVDRPRVAPETPASGLRLIQLNAPLRPEWRAQLEALGVDLLQYVPDDAFVVSLENVPPGKIRALEFVRWIGPYRDDHKLHPKLQPVAGAGLRAEGTVEVSILLSPRGKAHEQSFARGLMQQVRQESRLRFGTILRGRIDPARLNSLAASPAVLWIEPAPQMKLFDEISSKIVAGDAAPGLLYTESLGFDGSGVTVAVADSGLDTGETNTMHPDLLGRVVAGFSYGSLTDWSDEHSHGTHVAGIIAGNATTGEVDGEGYLFGLGVAPGASIVAQRLFDAAGGYHAPPSFETLTRDATTAGAEIGSNSWGDDTQGRYDLSAAEFDALVRDANGLMAGDQPYILEFSAGNAGPGQQTIGSPAVAKNVIATGASVNDRFDLPFPEFAIYDTGRETMADFSSRGPCEDGRIKPDIVAPGTWIASLRSEFANDDFAWWPISDNYMYQGGTSQSGPHASGAAAVFVQYYRFNHAGATPSPALVKGALINSAVDMDNAVETDPVPNNDEGWGRIDLTQLIGAPRDYVFVDQTQLLETSEFYERRIVVSSPGEPLKVTLTYTDVPGFAGAIPALVNDLDLEVAGPNGFLYRGNQFLNGESVPGVPSGDSINNVEAVHLNAPLPGEYVVRVRARNVPQDARIDTPAVDQDFALVISGALLAPGESLVALDRGSYTAPSQIKVTVVDPDRAGFPSVNVAVTSTTEPGGENLLLLASGSTGTFTGAVATATGGPVSDGQLQIAHNNSITASYFDASAGTTRAAQAIADLVAPVLTGVFTSSAFGKTTITWSSDEPSTSIVRYNTNSTLVSAATNLALVTTHSIELGGLIGNQTYFFHVSSADEAGNVATNNNGGSLFSFIAVPPTTVLLVDSYTDPFFGAPPLTGYTDPLNALNISFEVWDAATLGSPSFSILQGYQAVIWRVDELFSVWSNTERTAISNYLNSGGALMVASMDLLTRLQQANATNFIHNVLRVDSWLDDENGSTFAAQVTGSLNDPVGNGIDLFTDFTVYENLWGGLVGPDISDTIVPTAAASPVFRNDFHDIIGLRWPAIGQEAPGRLVFLSFPLDAVPMGSGGNDRTHLLRNVISFLVPGVNGLGTVALNSPAYPIPAAPVIEVADSDLIGAGNINVTAHSGTYPAGVTVTLNETVRPGVFRGFVELLSSGGTAAPGKLPAANGNEFWVNYFDASAGQNARASAVVDTIVPIISFVESDPGYQEAYVSWETSEPTDALVQFGESPLLERTAYSAAQSTFHEVLVSGLLPNRTYYFRVVSRDLAGNTATDNNAGALYTFQTLTPVMPPWTDNVESGPGDWTVIDAEDSESSWTRGTPNNAVETQAHSPVNAWGSNLDGHAVPNFAETVLLSPAIDLTGGNRAELRFWQNYEISEDPDFLEGGFVELYTNIFNPPVTIATIAGSSFGWEEQVIDLTPYAGKVVYLAWHYFFLNLTFETTSPPGWIVDDISVTVSNVAPGTIHLTNNLAQAGFILNGPTPRTGSGFSLTVTNASPGNYVVTYGAVPWYQSPPTQSNALASGGMLTFTGTYSFADANANGMSDEWELAHFGSVSPGRNCSTDTDGDGFPDCAEFAAGTNPTNATSFLALSPPVNLPNGDQRLAWPSVPGREYRVHSAISFGAWTPFSGWIRATASQTAHTFPPPGNPARYYRVEVRP